MKCLLITKTQSLVRNTSRFFAFVAFSITIISCGDSPLYQKKVSFESAWSYADSVTFNMPAPDTSSAYAMQLNISHTTDYPFQNIYFKISTLYPSGRRSSNLLNIDLADKSGAWYGACNGQTCVLSAPLRNHFAFSESGVYEIVMEQFTRKNDLNGLTALELELWKSYEE